MQMALATHMAQPTGSTATRGTFRVTINGFKVDQESWDDALQLDGKRDECFVWAEPRLIDHQGNTLIRSVNRSKIIGDKNGFPDRLQGGTASTVGGLRTGDVYPRNPPWQRVSAPQPDRLPMLVFEGDLVQGQQGVAIVPSIWEWDGNGDLFNDFLDILAQHGVAIAQALVPIITGTALPQPVVDGLKVGIPALRTALASITGKRADRALGTVKQGDQYVFVPQVLTLNFDTADVVAKTNVSGLGKGVLSVIYQDASELRGNYRLFLQVERLA
jgi:hypothetical protein